MDPAHRDDDAVSPEFVPSEVLSKLTLHDKVALLAGSDFWHTTPLPHHNVPKVRMSDGSSGIRGTKWFEGIRAALLPCGTALSATWDRELLKEAGELIGAECKAKGVSCWLGPTVNIQRSPLGGRGYESFSEDPYLTGIIASEMIKGCESTGVIAAVKHFICNDQEFDKMALNAVVTDRALREIYLRPFQIIARDAKPGALMTSYNKVNNVPVSQSKHLLQDVVREEWGWDPLIMSDWYGTYSTTEALAAGLDLEMPGGTLFRGKLAELAVSSNALRTSLIDKRVLRVLQFIDQASRVDVSDRETELNRPEDRELNRRLAQNNIVLLKNDSSILPLTRPMRKVALIGSHMKDVSTYATGATALEPYYSVTPYDAIVDRLPADVECRYEMGAYTHKMLPLLGERLVGDLKLDLFNDPSACTDRKRVDRIAMSKTYFQLLDYVNAELNPDTFYGSLEGSFVPDETGVWKFGMAVHGTAKLFLDEELVIDNTVDQKQGDTFFRQGTIEEMGDKVVQAGQTYRLRVDFGSASTSELRKVSDGSIEFPGGGVRLGACLKIEPQAAIDRAVEAARGADVAIICTGLNGEWESEGFDRQTMDLPPAVDALIESVHSVNPNTIVINRTGMPVTMPWATKVPAIMQAWYGGNESGNAIADVLFGDFNPCGKLPISWPRTLRENPAYLYFGSKTRVLFGDDIYVGCRWYDKLETQPLWSFGHGLSYTTFALSVTGTSNEVTSTGRHQISVSVKLENTGSVPGFEVVQLWVSPEESSIQRPVRELHGFKKVFLLPGEVKLVDVRLDEYAMAVWDEREDEWYVESGSYRVTAVAPAGGDNRPSTDEVSLSIDKESRWRGL